MKIDVSKLKGRGVFAYRITHEVRKGEAVVVSLLMQIKTRFNKDWVTIDTVSGMDGQGRESAAVGMAIARAEEKWEITLTKEPGKLIAVAK